MVSRFVLDVFEMDINIIENQQSSDSRAKLQENNLYFLRKLSVLKQVTLWYVAPPDKTLNLLKPLEST